MNTGVLGLDFETTPTQDGARRVANVVPGGPADKAGIRVGDVITRLGSRKLKADSNLDRVLNGTVGKEITVGFRPLSREGLGDERVQKVAPISIMQLGALKQRDWVKGCAELVKDKTKTKKSEVAYIHLSQMNPQNLQKFQSAVSGWMKSKRYKGMILDVRNNGGGNIHNQLMQILTTKPLAMVRRRGMQEKVAQPIPVYWDRPTVVLINERSFSDAEVFPYMFRAAGRGQVIGVPTAGGVIGTNDITLSDGTRFRIPRVGFWGMDGTNLEGLGVKPDILVEETPEDRAKGRDPQLLKAIEVVQAEIAAAASKKPEVKKPDVKPEQKPEAKPEAKPEPKPAPKPEPKPQPKPQPKPVNPAAGDPMDPLADVAAGEWVKYRVNLPGATGPSVVKVSVDTIAEDKVTFRQELEEGTVIPPLPTSLKRRDVLSILPLFGQVTGHKVADGRVEEMATKIVHADVRWPDGSELAMQFTNAVPCYGLFKVTMGKETLIEAIEWSSAKAAPKAAPKGETPKAVAAEAAPAKTDAAEEAPKKEEVAKAASTEAEAKDGADSMPAHPLYDAKMGEWVRIKVMVRNREMEMTVRVDEVNEEDDKIILKRTLHRGEQGDLDFPPKAIERQSHLRKVEGFSDYVVSKDTVKLTINGKELECFTVTATDPRGGEIKRYFCKSIPVDGQVRVERDGEVVMELVDWGTDE